MNPVTAIVLISVGLFVLMLLCLEVGFRFGRWRTAQNVHAHEGIGAIEAEVFAMLGLLLGFSFSVGLSRLDARRTLIANEANAIEAAYLRLDLLPVAEQPELRRLFREYLQARLRMEERWVGISGVERQLAEVGRLQREIWRRAVIAGALDPKEAAQRLLLPALNEMIAVTTHRNVALYAHLPVFILILLVGVALLTALAAGFAMAKRGSRSPGYMAFYAATISLTVYAILDLDLPHFGLIRVDEARNVLRQLQETIR